MQVEFLNQIRAETKLAKTMAELLDKERDALANSESTLINQLSQQKRQLLTELESLAKRRLQLVTQLGYKREMGSVRGFLSQRDPSQALAQSWDTLHRQLQLCADKNLINGRIISLSQRKTEMTLNVLRGQINQNNTAYDRMGKFTHQAHASSYTSA